MANIIETIDQGGLKIFQANELDNPHIEHLFGQSFELQMINTGDKIPVGGPLFGGWSSFLEFDFDGSELIFNEMRSWMTDEFIKLSQALMEEDKVQLGSKTFAAVCVISHVLGKYPVDNWSSVSRRNAYSKSEDGAVRISVAFDNNFSACSERSAAAQFFLQQQGVNSTYFNGEVLWNKEHEFADPHAFIVLREQDTQYVFDPMNPLVRDFPSIYSVNPNFDELVRQRGKKFIRGTNLFSAQEKIVYFGVGDNINIRFENLVE